MDYLALYSTKCKRCKHLDPEEEVEFNKCHYTAGNKECPASDVQFAVVGESKRFALAVKRSRASGNIAREVRILKEVNTRSPAFQHKFREWLSS
jgi:hypothetical protein